jgi:hypothetical protein
VAKGSYLFDGYRSGYYIHGFLTYITRTYSTRTYVRVLYVRVKKSVQFSLFFPLKTAGFSAFVKLFFSHRVKTVKTH